MVLQKPYMGPGNVTWADSQWRVVYLTLHGVEERRTRAVTMVNMLLPTDSWSQIHVASADMVVVEFHGAFGTIRFVSIYNDGDHDKTLGVLQDFMRGIRRQPTRAGPVYYLWLGDFNRHSTLWDEVRNSHLFTPEADCAVAPLLQLLEQYRMKMLLPQGIPTLRAKRTQNLTHPDNVFCSEGFLDFFISCNAYPACVLGTTDHFPIISMIYLVPPVKVLEERWDWKAVNERGSGGRDGGGTRSRRVR
jgi:hypothetical protein